MDPQRRKATPSSVPALLGMFSLALLAGTASAAPTRAKAGHTINVRTTAYTHTEADHLKHGRKTAAGTLLQAGTINSAAADWGFLPLGTTFRIKGDPDSLYRVDDYGRALAGTETVDIYRPSRTSMNHWGVRHVEIEIVEFGSIEKSIQILKGRTRYAHCRSMLARLRAR